ncbi:phosphogluconate dehydratase [Swaminathania salitolerans]|uniref:Phosphogluconate dehydratase n=1 Tax=Swaminathania salitolerans TaxID=182838 RepID=A0A511BNR7_9PROT|nr:phosphogluconate dehydratase [Swaminathania salitolerans]GBQ15065.1 phosphogluconate dehydratase [Swaminathania salitolerans LMG 21291]GEL01980.1 phosphogluconate dehydratase [Swaminathania salitolerans]
MTVHPVIASVTERIVARSAVSRRRYLSVVEHNRKKGISRPRLACGNLAHAMAASGEDKARLMRGGGVNLGVITSYNDMLSAHQPYARYPDQMKLFAREKNATLQVAGGVAAMCDGVTQGQEGMELSLLSRDNIAMSTAIGLSHGMFEGVALLGICDKIVPGLLIGALRFGHLPALLVPAGPMPSGLPNKEKQRVRQLYAEGKVEASALMEAEAASYHSAGTCTFYGTANTNQMMVELMGLMLPDSAFWTPNSRIRQALTRKAVHRLVEISAQGPDHRPLARMVDEKAIVNAAVGLLATGGSTNHAIHLPAIARAAGIRIDWADLDALSSVVPLLTRAYPNGSADVNAMQEAGGLPTIIASLCRAGMVHQDILTVSKNGFSDYACRARLEGEALLYSAARASADRSVLRDVSEPFRPDGGMRLVQGTLGRGIYKTSAVEEDRQTIEAPACVFHTQEDVIAAFKAGRLNRDVIVVVRFQGPDANGMPELHKLTPTLAVLQDKGYRVALLTDGRMSGASGKVPAAIHISPEAQAGGPIACIRDGDMIRICAREGRIEVLVEPALWAQRRPVSPPPPGFGTGRELFGLMRSRSDSAERGGSAMLAAMEDIIATQGETLDEELERDTDHARYETAGHGNDALPGHPGSGHSGSRPGATDRAGAGRGRVDHA